MTRPPHSQRCSRDDADSCCANCWELLHSPGGAPANGKPKRGSKPRRAAPNPDADDPPSQPVDFRCPCDSGYIASDCPPYRREREREAAHAPRYICKLIDSEAFSAADFRPSWIIKRLLVKDQPCILGGPKKALKTSLLIDLALSLGSGTPFLGQFTVYEKIRTVVISGESGPHTIQETARRVAHAKGIDLAAVDTLWDFRLPQLANAIELAELGRGLKDSGAEVCILDPLYLALLAGQGQQGLQATNLYDMGPLLLRVADACLNAGATPILAHHAKRGRTTGAYEPLDLDDLAFAGVAEFARQWMLLYSALPEMTQRSRAQSKRCAWKPLTSCAALCVIPDRERYITARSLRTRHRSPSPLVLCRRFDRAWRFVGARRCRGAAR